MRPRGQVPQQPFGLLTFVPHGPPELGFTARVLPALGVRATLEPGPPRRGGCIHERPQSSLLQAHELFDPVSRQAVLLVCSSLLRCRADGLVDVTPHPLGHDAVLGEPTRTVEALSIGGRASGLRVRLGRTGNRLWLHVA